MNETEKTNFTLETLKKKGTGIIDRITGFVDNAVKVFKKDESSMSTDEKIEKQHLLNFGYGIGAGIVIYHFMIGAVLILVIIWFYNLSLKKTKMLIDEKKPPKRTYKKRKTTEAYSQEETKEI
jgi:hypothetical protein